MPAEMAPHATSSARRQWISSDDRTSNRGRAMTLWCVIPAKPFAEAKTRLSPDVSPEGRAMLAARFFERTVQKVCGFAGPNPVIVVTRCPKILHLAQAYGAIGIHEGPQADVNAALATAASHAIAHGASGILAISADLPTVTAGDLAAMTADLSSPALAPDRHGTGSNALYWPGSRPAPYLFGPDSFRRHLAAIAALGLWPSIVRRPGLALDIDNLADLRCLEDQIDDKIAGGGQRADWSATRAARCTEHAIHSRLPDVMDKPE